MLTAPDAFEKTAGFLIEKSVIDVCSGTSGQPSALMLWKYSYASAGGMFS